MHEIEAPMKTALPKLLEELTALSVQSVELQPHHGETRLDAVVDAEPYRFLVEYKTSGNAAPVALATVHLKRLAETLAGEERAIPLVVVPFMGDAGKRICDEAGVAWLDLAGNARISAPGLRIRVEGMPRRGFKRPGHAFGPRSSRVARQLLLDPAARWSIGDLARTTDLSEKFASRALEKLAADGLVSVTKGIAAVLRPALLLDAWHEVYDFSKHRLLRGHIASRSGEALLAHMTSTLRAGAIEHAATGLAAAWKLAPFAGFRTVTFYVLAEPSSALLEAAGFREMDQGANVWLVLPNDKGVLQGKSERDGVACVSPVQAYLDLKGHGERAKEAAEALRAKCLPWSVRA